MYLNHSLIHRVMRKSALESRREKKLTWTNYYKEIASVRQVINGLFLVIALVLASVPALAVERWECISTPVSGSAKGLPGSVRISIDSGKFRWEILVPKFPLKFNADSEWMGVDDFLLEDNDVGAVAASPVARVDASVGTVIGGTITILNKA